MTEIKEAVKENKTDAQVIRRVVSGRTVKKYRCHQIASKEINLETRIPGKANSKSVITKTRDRINFDNARRIL